VRVDSESNSLSGVVWESDELALREFAFVRFSHAVFILVCTLYSWYSKQQNALALSISFMLLVGFAKFTARYFVREAYTLIKIKTDEQIGSPVRT
tara:strand:- start:1153 stop:1437 length:285 start_codon:yes stop_codon:yes gene_type:complete